MDSLEAGQTKIMQVRARYIPFGERLQTLIEQVLQTKQIRVLSVSHRVKQERSIQRKLASQPEKYTDLEDLHDLLGVRIITYLHSDVDLVSSVLRSEFSVDAARSKDKLQDLQDDQFGYTSNHLICTLGDGRKSWPEWSSFADLAFEVQVRSVLQHAWAEIEHDLGYKSETGIPAHLRRRFARLAGLLEVADSEFDTLNGLVDTHKAEVLSRMGQGVNLPLDHDSLSVLLASNPVIREADRTIAAGIGAALDENISDDHVETVLKLSQMSNYQTTNEIVAALSEIEPKLTSFAIAWLSEPAEHRLRAEKGIENGIYTCLNPGVALQYLSIVHFFKTEPPRADEFLASFRSQADRDRFSRLFGEFFPEVGS
ncbi:GTP pyrophosphokinase [Leucobacter sp. W1478]|uniref:GTP pyrophosphokinase n=1 Tax=Leucobacter sp. W1478 TaxID=3439065 RepID=UPI003F3048B4